MRLTARDRQVLLAVGAYRVLRRDQIQQLFFPSRNTANERLKRLYQHGFLERHWLPVAWGQGTGQALYTLTTAGQRLIGRQGGIVPEHLPRRTLRRGSDLFLAHALDVNQVRIAVTLAVQHLGYTVEQWLTEDALKGRRRTTPEGTLGPPERGVMPDAYFVLRLGDRRASFFLEVDRGTETRRRWRHKVHAYRTYVQSGAYTREFGTRSLRVLVVTHGAQRLANLKEATEQEGGAAWFWFAPLGRLEPEGVLTEPSWQVAGQEEARRLIDGDGPEMVRRDPP